MSVLGLSVPACRLEPTSRKLPLGFFEEDTAGTFGVKPGQVTFEVKAPAMSSAGIYDKDGHLIVKLWEMKRLEPGKQTARWDGRDQFGERMPPGDYHYEVVVNYGKYEMVSSIGRNARTGLDEHLPVGSYMPHRIDDSKNLVLKGTMPRP